MLRIAVTCLHFPHLPQKCNIHNILITTDFQCLSIIPIKYYAWMILDIYRSFLYIIPELRIYIDMRHEGN